jgi:prepilin-type N-terminal cleavage/methylation domain-containing protein
MQFWGAKQGQSRHKRIQEGGFTLLEVLVATALMGALAAVLLQVMTMGLRTQKASLDQTQALEVASLVLQEYSREAVLTPGTFQGEQGPFAFQVRIVPQYQVAAGRAEATQVVCYLVSVAVTWMERGASRTVELNTMRTVARGAA